MHITHRRLRGFAAGLVLLSLLGVWRVHLTAPTHAAAKSAVDPAQAAQARTTFARLPLRFEANAGQADSRVKFLARGSQATLWLTEQRAILQLRQAAALQLALVNAQPHPQLSGVEALPQRSHYFLGNDPARWRTNVAHYAKVKYADVYPGIDLVWYGQPQQLEYDFVVAPGADPRHIRFRFEGALSVRLNAAGALVLQLKDGEVIQQAPVVYQQTPQGKRQIAARYRLFANRQIGFVLGAYDHRQTLWIDPVLEYSTYLGGMNSDAATAIAVDRAGNTYVTGQTSSTDFPGPSPIQAAFGGFADTFVAKLDPTGSALLFATYLGGSGQDVAQAIALDDNGNVFVTGQTSSTDFPISINAAQKMRGSVADSFVTKIDANGSGLMYSTYLGGDDSDLATGIAVDAAGNAVVVGISSSTNLPNAPRQGYPLYKSTNRADAWNTISNGLAGTGVNSLAVDPTNANVLYAASTTGIFKSADGGATWQNTGFTSNAGVATAIVIDPTNPQRIYVGLASGFAKSTNGGVSFTTTPNGIGGTFESITSLVLDPTQPQVLYAGTSRGIFKSLNGGDSWVASNNGLTQFPGQQQPPRVSRLVIDPTTPQTLYAAVSSSLSNIFKSTNGGATWTAMPFHISGIEVFTLILNPQTPLTLYASVSGFYGGVYKSTNGGQSWTVSNTGLSYSVSATTIALNITQLAIDPQTPNTMYAASQTGGLFKSTDGGATWRLSRTGLNNLLVTSLTAAPNGVVYAGTNSGTDAFVTKLNPPGSAFTFWRMLGGHETEQARGVALDGAGNIYVTGTTNSFNFPVSNPLQAKLGTPADFIPVNDAFVTKLNPAGTELLYSTYLGGTFVEMGRAITVDAAGNAYVLGTTTSNNFPTTPQAFHANRTIANTDLFLSKLNAAGTALEFSTYLGGSNTENPGGLAVDGGGNVYVTGTTNSYDFPVVNTLQIPVPQISPGNDAFISKFNATGSTLLFSTFLGGQREEVPGGIALDAQRNLYVTGATGSSDFPTLNPLRANNPSGTDAFLVKLSAQADLTVTSQALPNPLLSGGRLNYTVTVTNQGPDEAVDAIVTDRLPTGLTNAVVTTSQGACTGTAALRCTLGELAAGATATITISGTAPTTGPLEQTANVTSATFDPVINNNEARLSLRISASPSIAGRVTLPTGAPLPGVRLTLADQTSTPQTTDATGAYQFSNLLRGTTQTLRPARAGFAIRPLMTTFADLQADQIANFTATPCAVTLSQTQQAFGANGGGGTLNVTVPGAECTWRVQSNAPWITLTTGADNSGNGTVQFAVGATNTARSGTLTIGERTFTVQQEFEPCATPSFRTARTQPLPSLAPELLQGDFNGDGNVDLVQIGITNNPVQLLLGDGRGSFAAPVRIELGMISQFQTIVATAGDLNSDGKDDLAVATYNAALSNNPIAVITLLGSATSLGTPRSGTLAGIPSAMLIAAVNGDGHPDLLLFGNNGLNVLPGNGDGTFGAAINTTNVPTAQAAVAADFNRDGKNDLALVGSNGGAVLLGDGAGRFSPPTNLQVGSAAAIVTADLDRDGNLDLALTSPQTSSGNVNGALLLLRGDGAGRFSTPATVVPLPAGAGRMFVRDFNQDGLLDLTVFTPGLGIALLPGSGALLPRPPIQFSAGAASGGFAVGDFNRDGKLDLAVQANNFSPASQPLTQTNNAVLVILDNTGVDFVAPRDMVMPLSSIAFAMGDFNADGLPDVVTAQSADFAVRLLTLTGEYTDPILTPVQGASGNRLLVRDFNRDGRLDLIAYGTDSVAVWLGDGRGGFQAGSRLSIPIPLSQNPQPSRSLAVADFNGDGRDDFVTLNSTQQPALYLNNGAGGFAAPVIFGAGQNLSLFLTGDFNGDGKADVAASLQPFGLCTSGATSILLYAGDGQGGFSSPVRSFINSPANSVLAEDFNYDGRTDLVFGSNCFAATLAVAFGNANGTFSAGQTLQFETLLRLNTLSAGDINNDGRFDLVFTLTQNNFGATVYAALGKPNGEFDAPIAISPAGSVNQIVVGDFNNDRRTDLILSISALSSFSSALTLIPSTCFTTRPLAVISAASFTGARFASESIAAAFGERLTLRAQSATTLPLPRELAGATVRVLDSAGAERLAQLYFAGPSQINFLIPPDTTPGAARVTIHSETGVTSVGTIQIAPVAPALFTANANGQGVPAALALRVRADGLQRYEPIARLDPTTNRFVTVPIDMGGASDQVFLILNGTGFRARSALSNVSVRIGGPNSVDAPVSFAGAQGDLVGLDQLNILLPRTLIGRGEVDLVLTVDGQTANTVRINIR